MKAKKTILKRGLGINVLQAAQKRIARVFDEFPAIYLSFSGGKDSGVLFHLVAEEARRCKRRFGVLFVDLEAQYQLTIDYVVEMLDLYADVADPYWLALPLNLRNAVSQFEPQWQCWQGGREAHWVRQPHPSSITDPQIFPWFRPGMEFEQAVIDFGHWYADGRLCCCLVGIRADESLNRWRTIARRNKYRYQSLQWTTWKSQCLYNAYPIYDWRTQDIWTYHARTGKAYNRLYERMQAAGLTIHQARICQPYGDDQRRGLWLFHLIEPDTWARVVARVNGANQGALYVRERGNILGYGKITKPSHLTWEQFAHLILDSLPDRVADHYRDKIATFIHWYYLKGWHAGIPDEGPPHKGSPSWSRICKVLLRNDYWCKGLSFSQTLPESYSRYKKIMAKRRAEWGIL